MPTGTATWLDIMPAIPLAVGVPMVPRVDSHRLGGAVVVLVSPSGDVRLANDHAVDGDWHGATRWRVDLDDPQGFGYALRWYSQAVQVTMRSIRNRHTFGETTDADRLALAEAVAKVAR